MGETEWLSDQETRAWEGFLATSALLDRRIEHQLREEAGVSQPQYEILVRLERAPEGELRMTELADLLLTSKSGLSYQVTQMERSGLVRRRTCSTDVRGVFAVLTEKGRDTLYGAAPGHVALVRRLMFDQLTSEQVAVLADGFGAVSRRLRDDDTA
ncbi:MarR family winged helix-turn-helix transcriptional regulator [Streptomyces sp. NPDC051569]|uniref:MarR family winged helix-turn-helix transcriptional regulator n=1 Tax=Streptomyces sp. NPDC051569 TaxID=3365661 RepID=UPI0037BB230E